ncbi:MAG TPA: penicillin-binding protein 2 [Acidimicrobiales bacterium]|nr:penicillin-binding protein 2 [Acidimicrobiales bacterium]
MTRQIKILAIALMVLYSAVFLKLNQIQVVQAHDLAHDPRNSRVATRDFARPRGVIQTADGIVVAQSTPTDDQLKRLRQYPAGPLYAPVTGYFSFTFGAAGIERDYTDYLSGRNLGSSVKHLSDVFSDKERTGNVTLTIRDAVQRVAAQQLGNRRGAVVAIDPTTGGLIALVNFPTFDPNPLAGHDQKAVRDAWNALEADPAKPRLPRAYREIYAPGSTFKLVTASAALERKPELATKSYPFLRQLDLPHTNNDLPNFGGSSCGGVMPQLLKVSCNTGFAQMGLDLGTDALLGEAEDYGFGSRPPLDLAPGSVASRFPDSSGWLRDDPALAQSAIGQNDVAATPLQMALIAAAIANHGVLMKPHAMGEIRDDEGDVIRRYLPTSWRKPITADVADQLTQMMIGVVQGGTATGLALPGIKVAGKTGTAQTTGKNAHAWIVGFAPADAPKIAVAVIVESQPGLGDVTGGRIAAPIARAVIQAALNAP